MPVHVAITRRVRPGCEKAFEESLRQFFQDSFDHEGVLGVHLISPPQGSPSREFGILRTFSSEQERDAFYGSDLYRRWLHQVDQLTEGERIYRELHGLEAWFQSGPTPARWKMALVTWLGVWPTVMIVPQFVRPLFRSLPLLLSSAIAIGVVVALLTWIVMPFLVWVFRRWLH